MIVSKLIGKRALKKEMVNNKGQSPFDIITVLDIAYTLAIIENNREKWDQELSIMYMSPEEQEKYKDDCMIKDGILQRGLVFDIQHLCVFTQ